MGSVEKAAMGQAPTYVTRPFLPPRAEFDARVDAMWESRQLTNAGPFHAELERELAAFLGVEHLALFTNGTIALLTALQALGVTGEVITTPYSFVATAHALLWNNLTPVFADIDAASCNLDPARVAAAVSERTTAILPVHCYGGPCDHAGLAAVAEVHGLKILYDAAHAFAGAERRRSVHDPRRPLRPPASTPPRCSTPSRAGPSSARTPRPSSGSTT